MRIAKEIAGRQCPKCGSAAEQIMFWKNLKGIQRYRCKKCGKIYTMEKPQPLYPEEVKEQAIKAYYSGLSARQVGKMFGMDKANVPKWIKKRGIVWISPETKNDESQMDELFWFIKRKERTRTRENTYIILLISTSPRQILGYYAGKYRNAEEMQKIVDEAPRAKVYCTDGNFTYKNVIFHGDHRENDEDKSNTHDVESVNADLRTYNIGIKETKPVFLQKLRNA